MQGISDTRHRQLVDALLQLENVLNDRGGAPKDIEKAADHRRQLIEMKANYDHFVSQLAQQIDAYFAEYEKAKVKFLGVKSRELKRQIAREARMFELHRNNGYKGYGT
ncbi:hypothetical protein [Mucilaginibacter conchicola]|nr:hypothetical protein [Mucilaginibacter conchicola]